MRGDAESTADLIEGAAVRRLALEREQGQGIVERAANKPAAEATERQVMAAWMKWYDEALDSVLRLPAAGPTDRLRERIARAKSAIRRQASRPGLTSLRQGYGGPPKRFARRRKTRLYLANTSAIGVIRTFSAAMFSFRAPIT